ncbi:hypothetical protein H0H87_003302 [Tephrocybe sp. NHM501043]|nr:hypothetical protein H0H87_003302 [Tephrocybe sp. NHM501043]
MSVSPPLWLAKYSDNSYLLLVFKTLASREREREIARTAAWKTSLDSQPQSIPLSRIYGIINPLKQKSTVVDLQEHYSIAVGTDPLNLHRNRYLDIQPYDRTRVRVTATARVEETEGRYLNASWVLERYGQKWWIASQAPLPNTAHTFLSLFLQPSTLPPASLFTGASSERHRPSRIRTIVQLTNDIEGGRRKAHPYFPSNIGQSTVLPPEDGDPTPALIVTLTGRQVIEEAHCVLSTLSLRSVAPTPNSDTDGSASNVVDREEDAHNHSFSNEQEPVTFHHMLYTSWPDHGVPRDRDRASLLAFIQLVDRTNRDTSLAGGTDDEMLDPDPPIIVGCSAGIGRTGSFIAISSLLRNFGFLPKPGSPALASMLPPCPLDVLPEAQGEDLVVQEVDSLREQRPGMVQRNEQIALIYDILASAFTL